MRTQLQMVFQDSYSSLNPRKHVFEILSEPMLYHKLADRHTAPKQVKRLLDMVGLPHAAMGRYPHEFSGGQRQRIGIAKALSLNPRLLVCDEPVSALDVSIQAQILNLLRSLQQELNLTCIFIGHGLGAVNYVSHRIAVMYLGQIVELADNRELFENPVHPYSKALFDAVPVADPRGAKRGKPPALKGEVQLPEGHSQGCPFYSRCPYHREPCLQGDMELKPIKPGSGHLAPASATTKFREEKDDMTKYIIKRLLIAIPTLIGITIIDYAIMCFAGSPLEMLQGARISQAAVAAKEAALGLDKPFYIQYFIWVGQLFQGNMGYSIKSYEAVSA